MSSEFDDLIEDRATDVGPLVTPKDAAPPLTDEEHQEMEETLLTASEVLSDLGVPDEPDLTGTELRLLKDDQVPVVGQHYVVWGDPAKPMPVIVGTYAHSLNDHLANEKADTPRDARAQLYASWRYKGFLCGQVAGL